MQMERIVSKVKQQTAGVAATIQKEQMAGSVTEIVEIA